MIGNVPKSRLACAVALTLSSAFACAPALAQERASVQTLDARLGRVERVLDQSLLGQLQRIDGLQQELRELRGELEELANENRQLRQRSGDLYTDTDQRLGELEQFREEAERRAREIPLGEDGLPLPGFEGGLDETLGGFSPGLDETASGSTDGIGSPTGGASPGRFVSGRNARSGQGGANRPVTTRTNATQVEKEAYGAAYDRLARGDNQGAMAEFDAFLERYPDGPYSFNAWYWKGEAKYAEKRFGDAIEDFLVVTEAFPNSTKVPDAQLKIGFALYEQGEYGQARGVLESVRDNFEGRSAGVLARKRLQKMDREGV